MGTYMAPWIASPRARWCVARGAAVEPEAWSPFAVREALYTGTLDAHARVWELEEGEPDTAPADRSRWPCVGSVPEFGAVLRVRGLPLGPEDGARRLATVAEARKRVRIVETSAAPVAEVQTRTDGAHPTPPERPDRQTGPRPRTDPAPGPNPATVRMLAAPAPGRPLPAGVIIGGAVLLVTFAMWLFLSA
jgi:hypothetical protein